MYFLGLDNNFEIDSYIVDLNITKNKSSESKRESTLPPNMYSNSDITMLLNLVPGCRTLFGSNGEITNTFCSLFL